MYIIHPIWFYFMDLVDELNFDCGAIMVCCILGAFILIMSCVISGSYSDITFQKKALKVCAYVFSIATIVAIIAPTKETMLSMMVAKFATYENATWTLDTIKAAVDYMVSAFTSIA